MLARELFLTVDDFLRRRGAFLPERAHGNWRFLCASVVLGGFIYGVVMGSYSMRPLQCLYSGIKVPVLLAVATALALPSFYVANALLGLSEDFFRALRGVIAAQAVLAIVLTALAPLTAFLYLSVANYKLATLLNGLQFFLATVAGQLMLHRYYAPLVARNPRHRIARSVWVVVYVFVAIQAAWILRPFIGSPELDTGFLREDAWSNAYVFVARLIAETLLAR